MTRIITPENNRLEVADILRKHIGDYQNQYRLWPEHKKIVSDLLKCRTVHLGGHIDRCDNCGTVRIIYHSCRNRHCPKCQHMPRERWLEKRKDEILPLKYFHVVFTLPHELNTIILNNKKVMLNCLFTAASKTLLTFGKNQLNGTPGFLAILHTWDQKLKAHFHLHCLVAGGVVSKDNKPFIACPGDYLFNQEALSLVFRGKFMQCISQLCQSQRFKFSAKDRKKNRTEPITISAVEFIRRFLLHSLPNGFVRIRHYGFLANRNRMANLKTVRRLLKMPTQLFKMEASLEEMMLQLTGIDITTCPCCNNKGKMKLLAEIPSHRARAPNKLTAVAA